MKPAFYALRPGGWRDYVTLLHPPYTLWHLSYVVVGACVAPDVDLALLALTLLAFLLAMGIGAHALDELQGRPLRTRIPAWVLVALAAASLALAAAIGVAVAVTTTFWLLGFVAVGAFLVVAYNLELFGGRVHGPVWFALAWGSFPLVTAYFAQAERVGAPAVAGAVFAFLLSLVQQRLSVQVRAMRRRVAAVSGELELVDGTREPVTHELLYAAPEAGLRLLSAAAVALAATLLVFRLGLG